MREVILGGVIGTLWIWVVRGGFLHTYLLDILQVKQEKQNSLKVELMYFKSLLAGARF